MPDFQTTVDPETGHTIKFQWLRATPPTQADLERVWKASRDAAFVSKARPGSLQGTPGGGKVTARPQIRPPQPRSAGDLAYEAYGAPKGILDPKPRQEGEPSVYEVPKALVDVATKPFTGKSTSQHVKEALFGDQSDTADPVTAFVDEAAGQAANLATDPLNYVIPNSKLIAAAFLPSMAKHAGEAAGTAIAQGKDQGDPVGAARSAAQAATSGAMTGLIGHSLAKKSPSLGLKTDPNQVNMGMDPQQLVDAWTRMKARKAEPIKPPSEPTAPAKSGLPKGYKPPKGSPGVDLSHLKNSPEREALIPEPFTPPAPMVLKMRAKREGITEAEALARFEQEHAATAMSPEALKARQAAMKQFRIETETIEKAKADKKAGVVRLDPKKLAEAGKIKPPDEPSGTVSFGDKPDPKSGEVADMLGLQQTYNRVKDVVGDLFFESGKPSKPWKAKPKVWDPDYKPRAKAASKPTSNSPYTESEAYKDLQLKVALEKSAEAERNLNSPPTIKYTDSPQYKALADRVAKDKIERSMVAGPKAKDTKSRVAVEVPLEKSIEMPKSEERIAPPELYTLEGNHDYRLDTQPTQPTKIAPPAAPAETKAPKPPVFDKKSRVEGMKPSPYFQALGNLLEKQHARTGRISFGSKPDPKSGEIADVMGLQQTLKYLKARLDPYLLKESDSIIEATNQVENVIKPGVRQAVSTEQVNRAFNEMLLRLRFADENNPMTAGNNIEPFYIWRARTLQRSDGFYKEIDRIEKEHPEIPRQFIQQLINKFQRYHRNPPKSRIKIKPPSEPGSEGTADMLGLQQTYELFKSKFKRRGNIFSTEDGRYSIIKTEDGRWYWKDDKTNAGGNDRYRSREEALQALHDFVSNPEVYGYKSDLDSY